MAQMKACDMPMQEFISLSLPGQVDGHVGVLQHDEAGAGLFHFFSPELSQQQRLLWLVF